MKELVIAEKPSVAKDLGRVLGCRDYKSHLENENYVVTWAVGHLVTLCEPEDYDKSLKSWRMGTLPIVPPVMRLKPIEKTSKQLNTIKHLMDRNDVSSLICATDSGREGELIFRYIYEILEGNKPFKRLWLSSMTDTAIKKAFSEMKDGHFYDNLYKSAKCRSEADWLVGINATRFYTIKYNVLLSVGRVQTPTLALIVDKQREIDAFVPRDYWEITATFSNGNEDEDETYIGLWHCKDGDKWESKIFEFERAEQLLNIINNKGSVLVNIEYEEKKQLPYLLYDLTSLQRDANKRFGFSAQKTLSVAQELYEKRKLITYPRTDSSYLSSDMQELLPARIKRLYVPEYQSYVEYILSLDKLPISKRIIDDSKITDHHAIIPTDKQPDLKTLSADERIIYDLVARRFLSVFYPPYIYGVTHFYTNAEDETFISKGKMIKQLGFMELYKQDTQEKDEAMLPSLKKGHKSKLTNPTIEKKRTKPPQPYTEASLLSAMENAGRFVTDEVLKEQLKQSGLGTPATRAAVIERLLQVEYLERKGKSLIPTEKAKRLIDVVLPELKSAETTGRWEKGLNSISNGTLRPERFMESITRYVYKITRGDTNAI